MPSRLEIDVDRLKHQHALGVYTLPELAALYGVSRSTIIRRLSGTGEETNRRCRERWFRQGPLPEVEKVCQWCFEFYPGNSLTKCCSDSCKREYAAHREFYIPIFKRELVEHFSTVELNRENCRKLGLTESEAKAILE